MHPPHMKCLKCLPEQDKFKCISIYTQHYVSTPITENASIASISSNTKHFHNT